MRRYRGLWPVSGKSFRTRLLLAAVLLVTLAVSLAGCSRGGLNSQLNRITAGQRFDLTRWEISEVVGQLGGLFGRPSGLADRSAEVKDYFSNVENATIPARDVSAIIEAQIRQAYHDAGVNNPFDKLIKPTFGFPPVNIYLRKPPHLLVVSPRDHIERIADVLLLPDMTTAAMEKIEDAVARLGYSGLVVDLGGIATYPSYVSNQYGLEFALQTAAHEWLHQYLAFTPLGFDYVLDLIGLRRNPDIAAINETVASLVGDEIGTDVYNRYYAANVTRPAPAPTNNTTNTFDFNAAMRETRVRVDALLAQGKVDEAEAYMNQRRDYINAHGYYIRKLNQAYFAFYGTYTNAPTSVDPLGQEMRDLRAQSGSLKSFLDTVTALTTRSEVAAAIGK